MLTIRNLELSYGERTVLRGVDLAVQEGECLAVVGPNGCGKSTFLRVLAGIVEPHKGSVNRPNRATIGYLPQEADLDTDRLLRDELRDAFTEVLAALDEMETLQHRMAETDPESAEHERVMRRYAECSHIVEHHDGYALEAQTGRVAAGLGFSNEDMDRSCREFSGGWQMRILLAKLLLRKPDVMLMDEPTNHLDLESTLWLEDWIKNCGRTVLLVTHERSTMDRIANRIVCLSQGIAEIYPGDYSAYLRQSAEKRQAQWDAYVRQQEEIERIESFIRRFRATASRAALVQSRIKQLEKIERLEPPFHPTAMHFSFPAAPKSYSDVITAENLGHRYGDHQVFSDLRFNIRRGERVGLVGVNGAGKSTLLRIIAGREKPTEGECVIGQKVSSAWFAQYDTDTLHSDTTLIEALEATAPMGEAQRARDVLGAFLFSGDDVYKSLSALSGGERTRFRLARMLFSPANLLLLDEPTNHLDVTSRATVEDALREYTGTVVVVSHDRTFMERVTTRVMEIEDGDLHDYPGHYGDYVAHKQTVLAETEGEQQAGREKPKPVAVPLSKEDRRRQREERKTLQRRIDQLERETLRLEKDVEQQEGEIEALDAEMAQPEVATNHDKLAGLGARRSALTSEHENTLEAWGSRHGELEQARAQRDALD